VPIAACAGASLRLTDRLLLALACTALAACADWARPPTFPLQAAALPLVQEQALVGLSEGGAAVVQLLAGDGEPPALVLLLLEAQTGSSRALLAAPEPIARQVLAALLEQGDAPLPLLEGLTARLWPEALEEAGRQGLPPQAPLQPEPGRRRHSLTGVNDLPLSLSLALLPGPPPLQALLLSEAPGGQGAGAEEVELCLLPLAGTPVPPLLWRSGGTLWMLAGSVLPGPPLRRTVGLRRASLGRGEAQLHDLHGLADYAAGELEAARREFDRALAADPRYVDALYNAASVAALSERTAEAVELLRRAVAEDPRRVEVLARGDEDLAVLRRRPDVRRLLGLVRAPPADEAPLR
jgi:hypothetical protein